MRDHTFYRPRAPLARVWAVVLPLAVAAGILDSAAAQSSLRGWGRNYFDTAVSASPAVRIGAAKLMTWVLRADGRVFARGEDTSTTYGGLGSVRVPPPPPGSSYVAVDMNLRSAGILSTGELVQWGGTSQPLPARPPGVSWLEVAVSATHSMALRSDGGISAWGDNLRGELDVPPLPPGKNYVGIAAGGWFSIGLVSDGTVQAWGDNTYGQCNVPLLPAGVTFVAVAAGVRHALGLRSDGLIEHWGDASLGQDAIPALPPGVTYTAISAEWHSLGLRSDGWIEVWGNYSPVYGQYTVPPLPPGTTYVQIDAGEIHSVALRSDGEVVTWGDNFSFEGVLPVLADDVVFEDAAITAGAGIALDSAGTLHHWGATNHNLPNIPVLPPGVRYVGVEAGFGHIVGMCSDGTVRIWGNNQWGQCNAPPLPPGLSYVQASCGYGHTVLLRSDGEAFAFGLNQFGEANVPPLPPGLRYIEVSAAETRTMLRRSDGEVIVVGYLSANVTPPPGVRYTQVAVGRNVGLLLRSDGTLDLSIAPPGPALPRGVYYVEVDCGSNHVMARRSDGMVVAWQLVPGIDLNVPPLDPGTSYTGIYATYDMCLARVGPTSTYVTFADGCAGSLPPARLVPRDTPRIGQSMQVWIDRLPMDVAFVVFGWNAPRPYVPLAGLGMAGCQGHVSPDVVLPVVGTNGEAVFDIAIPNVLGLIGSRFYNQAIVPDAAAQNGIGAVVSDAAEAVVGR